MCTGNNCIFENNQKNLKVTKVLKFKLKSFNTHLLTLAHKLFMWDFLFLPTKPSY